MNKINEINRKRKIKYKIIFAVLIFFISLISIYIIKGKCDEIKSLNYSENINSSMKLKGLYSKNIITVDLNSNNNLGSILNEDRDNMIFGRIVINKINLDYSIFNEYTEENLKILPCRLNGDNVERNISIIGHNYENESFFSNINKLEIDDEIKMIIGGNEYYYFVYKKYEVNEEDLEPLDYNGFGEITLITCNNLNKKRYIVKAKKQ